MWDTTALSLRLSIHPTHLAVNIGGIPYLAKNERDMGHPSFVREREADLCGNSPYIPPSNVAAARTSAAVTLAICAWARAASRASIASFTPGMTTAA